MITLIRNRNFWLMFLFDITLATCAYGLSYMIRFEGEIPPENLPALKNTIFWVVAVKVMFFFFFNLYRGMWRYTSLVDFMNVIKAVTASSISIILLIVFFYSFSGFPRSVLILDFLMTLVFIAGVRLGIRLYLSRKQKTFFPVFGKKDKKAKRLLLIGAGNTGEHVLREMMDNPAIHILPVGFLDDNRLKLGQEIHGVPVLGRIDQIEGINVDYDEILICAPSATGAQMRRIVEICTRSRKPFKTMPPLGELIDGHISLKLIREVSMTDIIGREEVWIDEEEIKKYLMGKRVLITGAGGSIGSELCRQICRFEPETIVLIERAESPLYEIDLELRKSYGHLTIVSVLGDIRDREHMRKVFDSMSPQIVFHAAAYKHVPMLEIQPWKSIENNVLGTLNLIEVSEEFGIERFVLVSTDKAVRPANVMGASKRVAEMITLSRNRCNSSKARFIAVRFGNVVGSVGSVVPLFNKQIKAGGPVTVTHPEVTRYFMTIRESSQLILQAGAMGQGCEVFILDMGTPVKIVDMARDLIRLSGFEPDVDIRIEFIGLRPGEKLYEELITADENALPTQHPKILMLKGTACDINLLNGKIKELSSLAVIQDADGIRSKLKEIVPDYAPDDRVLA